MEKAGELLQHRTLAVALILLMIMSYVAGIEPVGAAQSSSATTVPTPSRQYAVYSVRFGWNMQIDPGPALADSINIIRSQLGIELSLASYSFQPRYAPQRYDQRPPTTMVNEVVSLLPPKVGSGSEVTIIFSSLSLPTAQNGSQAYFSRYPTSSGERNVIVVWGLDGRAAWLPVNPTLLPFVIAHEFGHFLGYQHEDNPKCIMYASPKEGSSFRECKQFHVASLLGAGSSGNAPASSAAGKGACIIATTAFGSELAPQVAFLRSFRDTDIGSAPAGRAFIPIFNSWYYSFSPYVANIIGQASTTREFTRITIFPLIWTLSISEKLDARLGHEVGMVISGTFAAFAIGVIYFGPLAGLVTALFSRRRVTEHSIRIPLSMIPVMGIVGLIGDGWILSASTVVLVLLSMAVGAMIGSMALASSIRRLIAGAS